jgi:Carboxypeptidase regulatory-like domain
MSRTIFWTLTLLALCAAISPASSARAQGVTTSGLTGIVKDPQDAVIPGVTITAVHQPSSTTYEAVTQADGRYFIPGMRVGGPYTVTATLSGFRTQIQNDITLNLGVVQDVSFKLELATISEDVIVIGATSPIFASTRTGASTSVSRNDLATLPTISGRINDIARLAPQYGGSGTFAGQDNRMNNITVDGSYFNNSFGLGGQPGDRTGVAPISLEAVEQVQVSVAPYDVRQGNFVGAGVNMVTRSGTNRVVASAYSRYRNQSFVGTDAAGQVVNPGTFTTKDNGVFMGGPIIKNQLFAFGSFEKQSDVRPLTTYRANNGGEAVAGNVTKVLASDLDTLSSFLKTNFKYDTGPYNSIPKNTPAKPFLIKADYNLGKSNKVNFRYSQLDSSTDVNLSNSSSAGIQSRQTNSSNYLNFQSSNYTILENIRSGIGEWNSVLGSSMSNSLMVGYTTNDESRGVPNLFPFVDILDNGGLTYTSIGTDPFTPNNELRYHTFQAQDSFTKFSTKHSFTFGGSLEKYHSDNVFFARSNSVYTYNSLADFYADANAYLANPNRTTTLTPPRRFQVQWNNIPGLTKPLQPLEAWYFGGYVQDQWHVQSNLTVTAGLRVDTPKFKNTAYDNPNADALTFRDQNGNAVKYNSGKLPDPKPLWSPRAGFNWDVKNDQSTQVRGGTGIFTGKPAYVWISNQIGNTGMLTGQEQADAPNTANRGFNPDPHFYWPPSATITGAPATSYELDVTDPNFKFPQTWRSNIALDRMLPGGLVATGEYLYNRDINGMYYINANLPAAQSAFVGPDNRPRWTVNRINNVVGNQVTAAYVLSNQNIGRSWNVSGSLMKTLTHGFAVRGGYSYGISRNTVDPGSTASGNWGSNYISGDPNNPGLSYSTNSQGNRVFASATYTKEYFSFGSTTISAFWDGHPNGQTTYVFAGDMNGDSASNDLIYIPRNTSEMNFSPIPATATTPAFTADQEAAAWDAYINQDPYLSKHRGEYAVRNAIFLPWVNRVDFSIAQGVFHGKTGRRHSGEVRLDITNFGNLLNHNWGVSQSLFTNQILTNPAVDAAGRSTYRLALVNGQLPAKSFKTNASTGTATSAGDIYVMMVSFRYNFN